MLHYVLVFTIQKVACESCILQGFSHSQHLALPSPPGCRCGTDNDDVNADDGDVNADDGDDNDDVNEDDGNSK